MPVPRSGNMLLLGPLSLSRARGYEWHKTGHNKNFTVSGSGSDCAAASEDREEEYTYRVYCRSTCAGGLGSSWERKEAIDDVLDLAIASRGRVVLVWRENGAVMRRELLGGVAKEADFELQRRHTQVVPLDVTVTLKDSLILDPIVPGNDIELGLDWCTPTKVFKALLVDDQSSVLTEGLQNFLSDYSDLREFDGTGYFRQLVTARTCAVGGEVWSAADITFPNLGPGTNPIGALLVYINTGGNDVVVGGVPYPWFGGTFVPHGAATTFRINALGLFNNDAREWTV